MAECVPSSVFLLLRHVAPSLDRSTRNRASAGLRFAPVRISGARALVLSRSGAELNGGVSDCGPLRRRIWTGRLMGLWEQLSAKPSGPPYHGLSLT